MRSLSLVVLLAACGGASDSTDDAEVDLDASVADAALPFVVDDPAPIAPPRLEPCGAGYRDTADPLLCDPPQLDDCAAGSARYGLSTECERVGSECPPGEFAELLSSRATRFVDDDAEPGGDGSRERPFSRIADALAGSGSGAIVSVAKGTYEEALSVPAGVTVRGACASETHVVLPTSGNAAFQALGPDVHVRDMHVAAGSRPAIYVDVGASIRVSGLRIEAAIGLVANGGTVDAEDVSIDVRGVGSGVGGLARGEGSITLLRANVIGGMVGVIAIEDGTIELDRTRIEATNGGGGRVAPALAAESGGHAIVRESAMLGSTATAVQVIRGTLRMERSLVAGTHANAAGEALYGLLVFDAEAEVSTTRFESNHGHGIGIGEGATATIRDVVVRGAMPETPGEFSVGVFVVLGATAELERVAIADTSEAGLIIDGVTEVNASDLSVQRVRPRLLDDTEGRGIAIQNGGVLHLERAMVEGAHHVGLSITDSGTSLVVQDLLVRATESRVSDGQHGGAITVEGGARFDAERLRLENSHGTGIVVSGAGTDAVARHTTIVDVGPQACSETTCTDSPAGMGATSHQGASLSLDSFVISRASLCGAQVATEGTLRLTTGRISGSAVGACVQIVGYDVGQLTRDVVYVDNEANLDATSLPVPSSSGAVTFSFL